MENDRQRCCEGGEVTELCAGCPALEGAAVETKLFYIGVASAVLTVAFVLWLVSHARG